MPEARQASPLYADHASFAARLYEAMAGPAADQLVWSPYSVACALGLITEGARGRTRAELERLLGSDTAAHLAVLDEAVAAGPELVTSTALWLREELPVEPDFEARMRGRAESSLCHADFRGDPEGAREAINADVAKTTRGLIPSLLARGTVTPDTMAVLVNALWVRLTWAQPFERAKTRTRPFAAPSGPRQVPMMHRRGKIPYAQARGWRLVTLAGDHDLALDVVLPKEPSGAAALTAADLDALYRARHSADVQLALPRFELTYTRELGPALAKCGVGTVFTDGADLSGISPVPLRLDKVIHEARLRVDERGAEGAAATAAMMTLAAAVPSKPVEFTADRPFRFVLRRRGAILFLGQVSDPKDPA